MTNLTYILTMSHKDRGIGFTAKTALQNAQKSPHSPIVQAKFSGTSSSSETIFEIEVEDSPLTAIIENAINSSGRMPAVQGTYKIEKIELQVADSGSSRATKNLQRDLSSAQRQAGLLREENARLRQESTLAAKNKVEITTPLQGLLAYFETTNYNPEVLLEERVDLDFAHRVLSGEIRNTFDNYINHVLGRELSVEDIQKILTYQEIESEESARLRAEYETAKTELEYLEKLKSGKTDIPETLRPAYIKFIEDKKHEKTVNEYDAKQQEQKKIIAEKAMLLKLKEKYGTFSDSINLLTDASSEVPVIFNMLKNTVEIYFPFNSRDVKSGFIDDLTKELKSYFDDAEVELLEGKQVAYKIVNGKNLADAVDTLIEDTPVTLKVSGFSKIVPYRLG